MENCMIDPPERYEEPIYCPCGCGETWPDACSSACRCGCEAVNDEPCLNMPSVPLVDTEEEVLTCPI